MEPPLAIPVGSLGTASGVGVGVGAGFGGIFGGANLSTNCSTVKYSAGRSFGVSFFAISTLPRPEAFVDTGVRIVGSFGASELLLHARHPGTE